MELFLYSTLPFLVWGGVLYFSLYGLIAEYIESRALVIFLAAFFVFIVGQLCIVVLGALIYVYYSSLVSGVLFSVLFIFLETTAFAYFFSKKCITLATIFGHSLLIIFADMILMFVQFWILFSYAMESAP